MNGNNHTFAIGAYMESPYLEDAVRSVVNQTVKSKVIMVTGTPNEHIRIIAERYDIPFFINYDNDATTAQGNWKFAYRHVTTDYVTFVHQDDVYERNFAEEVLSKAKGHKSIIIFTDYSELRNNEKVLNNKLLKVKRLMNQGFRMFPSSKFVRKRILSIGCSICCPSVTFFKPLCGDFSFDPNIKCNCDWDAWIRLSEKKGDFIYINKSLMCHRVHEGSSTSQFLADETRHTETMEIYRRFWPEWFANKLIRIYEKGDKSNDL